MGGREKPLVSVVIPTHDRLTYLRRAIESVANQSYDPIELVVVDDCSDRPVRENLGEEVFEGIDRYEIIRHDENQGGSAARNTGIRKASGEYVAFLDDDDRWKAEKVARQVECFREEDVGVVCTGARYVNANDETQMVGTPPEPMPGRSELTKGLLCENFVGSCSCVMVETDAIRSVDGFDERFPSWQDQELYVRLSRRHEFGAVREPLIVYQRESPHRVSEDVESLLNETYPLFVQKFEPIAREYGELFRRKTLAWAAFRVGKSLIMSDRVREGNEYLRRAVTLYPFEPMFYKYLFPSFGGRQTYEAARNVKQAVETFR